ncbi:hypothetical protein STRAU_4532 [Streptomyces aurantiacus JA 4570]|uniref:Uncharacterized protein n=1 Tax=Streptomyces aurantiacus JA 4570 TaxID=1286094 RepID=S3ZIA6_9ACTN|nr:hypothetical protein STRAU_4532 [Streptomyces aurantiacus JA 4570]
MRFVRAAAGRRALQVLVLLAGLVVIGLVCGEKARAAEATTAEVSGTVGGAEVVEPVAESGARPAVERVVRPARAVADGAARAVDGVRSGALPDVRRAALPEPGRVLPEPDRVLPERGRVLPEPDRVLPAPQGPPPGPSLPGAGDEGGAGATAPAPPAVEDGEDHEGPRVDRVDKADRADKSGKAYGPGLDASYLQGSWSSADCDVFGERARGEARGGAAFGEHGTGGRGQVPLPGRPGGCVSGQSAGDGSSQRHADPCAAGPGGRDEIRLVAGACASAGADPVRERHRDILEFPG